MALTNLQSTNFKFSVIWKALEYLKIWILTFSFSPKWGENIRFNERNKKVRLVFIYLESFERTKFSLTLIFKKCVHSGPQPGVRETHIGASSRRKILKKTHWNTVAQLKYSWNTFLYKLMKWWTKSSFCPNAHGSAPSLSEKQEMTSFQRQTPNLKSLTSLILSPILS